MKLLARIGLVDAAYSPTHYQDLPRRQAQRERWRHRTPTALAD